MRISHIAAECSPFAKTGGLGDVAGSLPIAQAELGHDVSVWMPLYRQAWETMGKLGLTPSQPLEPFAVELGGTRYEVGVLQTTLPDSTVPLYLIGCDPLFDRPSIYSPAWDGSDDGVVRYPVFVRAAMEGMRRLWKPPQILHAHDWHTTLGPMALAWEPRDWIWNDTATVLTIHNAAYQGWYGHPAFRHLGLPAHALNGVDWHGALNLLKGGIEAADVITAVSPNFAREITTPSGGFGLDPILRKRSQSLLGIVNGIDPKVWNPAVDPKIPQNYDFSTIERKRENRKALLSLAGMNPDDPSFVVGAVGRLTDQKGYDLLFPVVDELLSRGVRIVFLGSGEKHLEDAVHHYSTTAPGRFWGYVGFQDALAHLIEAGADAFLMPSRFEPCGLNQLYSLAYGTPPIVRRVGGLVDTVEALDGWNAESATGFAFDAATPVALRDTVLWAQHCYHDPGLWTRIMRNGMLQDYSWHHSAELYMQVYHRVRAFKGLG